MVFVKVLVGCVKIIYPPVLLEYYYCAIVKVYVGGCVQLCVDGDPELGRHCGKVEYVLKGSIIKEKYKGQHFKGCGVVIVLV